MMSPEVSESCKTVSQHDVEVTHESIAQSGGEHGGVMWIIRTRGQRMVQRHMYQSHGMKANGKMSHRSIERDGSVHHAITHMAVIEKTSQVASLNTWFRPRQCVNGDEYQWR